MSSRRAAYLDLLKRARRSRAVVVGLVAIGIVLVLVSNPRSSGATCGTMRWPVKTLSDRGEKEIDFAPMPVSVERLRSLHRPAVRDSTPRIGPVEKLNYRLRAGLIGIMRRADRDIDVVIADPRHSRDTMVAAFPDVSCRGAKGSVKKGTMRAARTKLLAACGKPPRNGVEPLAGTVRVSGVGFFGEIVHLPGAAPNGIQLHPALDFASSDCRRKLQWRLPRGSP